MSQLYVLYDVAKHDFARDAKGQPITTTAPAHNTHHLAVYDDFNGQKPGEYEIVIKMKGERAVRCHKGH